MNNKEKSKVKNLVLKKIIVGNKNLGIAQIKINLKRLAQITLRLG